MITVQRKIKKEGRLRSIRGAIRYGLIQAALFWKNNILPKHFMPGAGNVYKYHPRTAKYIKRKQRKYGKIEPLVFSGRTETAMIGDRRRPVVTLGTVTVKLPADRYIHLKRKGWGGKRLRDEIIATTKAEEKEVINIASSAAIESLETRKAARNAADGEDLQSEGISLG